MAHRLLQPLSQLFHFQFSLSKRAVSDMDWSRYGHLKELMTLKSCGWEVIDCHGGVSMVAKPSAYSGKTLKLIDGVGGSGVYEVKLNDSNFRESILRATGLCINSGSWTGIPGYCRFTLALEDAEFEQALECIVSFKKLVLGD